MTIYYGDTTIHFLSLCQYCNKCDQTGFLFRADLSCSNYVDEGINWRSSTIMYRISTVMARSVISYFFV